MKGKKITKLSAWLLVFALVVVQMFSIGTTTVQAEETAEAKTVLWSGEATTTGSWSPWTSAVDIDVTNADYLMKKLQIEVKFKSAAAPVLVMQSWTGGKEWVQFGPLYQEEGVAYYTYDTIKQAVGEENLPLVNLIKIMPCGQDLTVTEVSYKITDGKEPAIKADLTGPAADIVKNINAGMNLGNTLDAHGAWIGQWTANLPENYETAWGSPVITKEMIDGIKDAGFKAIRIPVTWTEHIGDKESGYKINQDWMNRVHEIVDYAVEDDLYIILNVHHDTGTEGWLKASNANYEENNEKFAAVWNQIATSFKGYSKKLLFEGFNEILNESNSWSYPGGDAGEAVNKYNQLFVDTVRATGGNNASRCLIVNTYAAKTDADALAPFVLPTDSVADSLIVEVHYYDPFEYCQLTGKGTQDKWKDNGGEAALYRTFYGLNKYLTSKNIPVIIGEIAATAKNNTEDRVDWITNIVKMANDQQIKIFWWDTQGDFVPDETLGYPTGMAIYNRKTCEFGFPEIKDAIINNAISEQQPISLKVKVEQSGKNSIDQKYILTNTGNTAIDLSKLAIRYEYTKSGDKEQEFKCDYSGITMEDNPYFADLTSKVTGTFGDGYVEYKFAEPYDFTEGTISVNTRFYQKDWSSYENYEAGHYEVFYDGKLVQTF